jgi:hypothetical protein
LRFLSWADRGVSGVDEAESELFRCSSAFQVRKPMSCWFIGFDELGESKLNGIQAAFVM